MATVEVEAGSTSYVQGAGDDEEAGQEVIVLPDYVPSVFDILCKGVQQNQTIDQTHGI